ncbi:MAG: MFS transporter [Candidatus Saccharimonadales bacterium]
MAKAKAFLSCSTGRQAKPAAGRSLIFAVLMIGMFMALIDVTVVNVALPSIQHGLNAGSSVLEWVVSGYVLAVGLLLITAGRIGDNIGHRWTFLVGLAIFTLASLTCSLAQNSGQLIASRALQGAGAGIFTPAVTAFIQLLFQGKERSRAFSLLGAIIGVATAIGPLLGGLLVQAGGLNNGWRLVFLINVPIGAVLFPLAYKLLPHDEGASERRHNVDPLGIGLLSAGLLLLLIPLVEGQQLGWPIWTYICFIAAVPVFTVLWQHENRLDKRGGEPLLPTHLLRQIPFAAGSLLSLVYFASFTSLFFILSIFWQDGLQRGALATGLMIVPFAIGSMISASVSDKFSARLGRGVLVLGAATLAIGLALVLFVLHIGGYDISAYILTGPLFLAGLGNGLFIAPNMDFVLASVPGRDAGAATGVLNTARRVGSALGIAAIGTTLFGTLKFSHQPHALALTFSRSAQLATLVAVILIILALAMVSTLPKKITA